MSLVSFSGIASGIDTDALIKATLDAQRRSRITPIQDKNDALTEQNSALDELNSKLKKLDTASQKFRALNGGGVQKAGTSSNEAVLTASASNSAQPGTYGITVTSVARNGSLSFGDRFSSATSAVNSGINNGASAANRTVSFTVGTGATQENIAIELTNSTTIEEVVSSFNTQANGANASLVNLGTTAIPSYAMFIATSATGTEAGSISVSVGSEIQSAGAGAFKSNTLEQATNAQFSISGLAGTITRSSNSISDLVPGLSLELQSTGTSTVKIGTGVAETSRSMKEFVDAYNDVVKYINTNDAVSSSFEKGERINSFGPLSDTQVDESILSSIRAAISGARSGSSGTVRILADVGITSARDGTLSFDQKVADSAIASNTSGVQTLFENLSETLSNTSTGVLTINTRFNGIIDLTKKSNQTSISNNAKRVEDLESSLAKQEEAMRARFARLEGLMGRLQSQQNSLSSLLAGL